MQYRICFKSVKTYCVYVGLRKRTYFKAFQAFGHAGASQENQSSAQGAKGSKMMVLCPARHKQMGARALSHSDNRGANQASPALPSTRHVGPHGPLQGEAAFSSPSAFFGAAALKMHVLLSVLQTTARGWRQREGT